MERISDLISQEEIKTWTPEIPIFICAGTGSGKSYFMKNCLYEYAKNRGEKILMLVHRSNCENQFGLEIVVAGKNDNINIQTYQSLEQQLPDESADALGDYQYIVCDECHYFLDDAAFNNRTDISLDKIMKTVYATKIFMSATGENINAYIRQEYHVEFREYGKPSDYSCISRLVFYHNKDAEEDELRGIIRNGEKAIVFIEKAKEAYELYQKFSGDALFCCSKSNAGYHNHVDSGKIEKMLSEEKFEEPVLITTSCLDAGVNIIDRKVKHIFVNLRDVHSLIQCIGRKRIQDNADKITVHIRAISNSELRSLIRKTRKQLEMADYRLEHTDAEFYQKYFRKSDKSGILYEKLLPDGSGYTKEVNKLMYTKKKEYIQEIQQMLALGEYGYCKYLARKFQRYDRETGVYDYQVHRKPDVSLEAYLRKQIGHVMLTPADRKELIERLAIRRDGHLKKSREILNAALKEMKMPYKIEEYETSRTVAGKKKKYKHAWRIVENKP